MHGSQTGQDIMPIAGHSPKNRGGEPLRAQNTRGNSNSDYG